MKYNEIFVENMELILYRKKMTKKELSIISGRSMSSISNISSLKANPSLNMITDLAKALNVPLSDLFRINK